jgi:hypothetical protein
MFDYVSCNRILNIIFLDFIFYMMQQEWIFIFIFMHNGEYSYGFYAIELFTWGFKIYNAMQ